MRRIFPALTVLIFGTVSASPADLAVKARPPALAMAAVYNWTGFFVGANIGYGWGQDTNPFLSFADNIGGFPGFDGYFAAGGNGFSKLKPAGIIGGGQIGYNWQINQFVLGAVADFQGADVRSSATAPVDPPGGLVATLQTLSQRLDVLGTVRGKAGLAINDLLLYGTGGLAYGRVSHSMTFDMRPGLLPYLFTGTSTDSRTGWAAGLGGEYGVGPWSFGLEYLHYDLGRSSVTALSAPPGGQIPGAFLTVSQRTAGDIVRATINYRFDTGDGRGGLTSPIDEGVVAGHRSKM